jgi:hypothetical protein
MLPIAPMWGQTQSSVARLVRFSGDARDAQGSSLAGAINITFSLYQNQQGGGQLWQEAQSVQSLSRVARLERSQRDNALAAVHQPAELRLHGTH